jgi:hypothetical protein
MLHGLAIFFFIGALVIGIHKLGHYLTGRWLVGIPQSDIKLVVADLPQYVALRNGTRWTSPTDFESYLTAYHQHDSDSSHIVPFLAAGELLQTVGVVAIAGVGVLSGVVVVAQSAVLVSLILTSYHLFSDFGLNFHMGHPTGDFSALWSHSPITAVVVFLLFAVPHGVLYAILI